MMLRSSRTSNQPIETTPKAIQMTTELLLSSDCDMFSSFVQFIAGLWCTCVAVEVPDGRNLSSEMCEENIRGFAGRDLVLVELSIQSLVPAVNTLGCTYKDTNFTQSTTMQNRTAGGPRHRIKTSSLEEFWNAQKL